MVFVLSFEYMLQIMIDVSFDEIVSGNGETNR